MNRTAVNLQRKLIEKPILTEKTTFLREGNTYTFKVDSRANKIQIRQAIEALFEVKVKAVRTVSVPSKPRRQGAIQGRRAGWKKAYVTLRQGETIEALETV
jgi:large subunit ribosomal protein L23